MHRRPVTVVSTLLEGDDGGALEPIPKTIALAKQPGFFGSRLPQQVGNGAGFAHGSV